MKSSNLITTCEGYEALTDLGKEPEGPLKAHEIKTLLSFCNRMMKKGCTLEDFNGYFIGYSIRQIGKEFDLLKFTRNYILNIELKAELLIEDKEEKIIKQMRTNHYYLNAISRKIIIFTYVENDGIYHYLPESNSLQRVSDSYAAQQMMDAKEDRTFDPDQRFIPSAYLISPYDNVGKFLHDQYFLTTAQNAIKKEILDLVYQNKYRLYTLQASTGTGKTLLLYDIAKEMMDQKKAVRILHTQPLNPGQQELIQKHQWDILSLYNTPFDAICDSIDLLCIDEAQLLSKEQLYTILLLSKQKQVPILFAYDPKQEQYRVPSFDLAEYIQEILPNIEICQNKLTNKIRTNKEMADFIDNVMKLDSNHNNDSFHNISIDYITNPDTLDNYKKVLQKEGYDVIDVTSLSLQEFDGQEYKKAALILDQSFYYEQNVLHSTNQKEEVLYQVITRVMDELKIIVIQNPAFYQSLLGIIKNH